MKKVTLIAFAISLMAVCVQAQTKIEQPPVQRDTVFVLNMKDFKEYASAIDRNVDSKTVTRDLIAFLEQRIAFIPKQQAEKPKEPEQPKKKN